MPYYSQYIEAFGSPSSNITIDVVYDIDNGNTVTGVFPLTTGTFTTGVLRGIPGNSFRQQWKLPIEFEQDECDETKFNVSGYSNLEDRIVYIGEDLSESLNGEYTGCCFDENGNFVAEPSLGQERVIDITLKSIGFDAFGKPYWQGKESYKDGCISVSSSAITREETFTIEFTGMTPSIQGGLGIDDDITVTLRNSNGSSVVADKDSVSSISMTAVYPETVTIEIRGEFSKKLFPYDTWEYYYNKDDEYTPVSGHLPIEIDINSPRAFDEVQESESEVILDNDGNVVQQSATITSSEYNTNIATSTIEKELPEDPNDYFDAYRIDQDNKNGVGLVRDLSLEIPSGVNILRYEQDTNEDIDVLFNFNVTSSIPALTTRPWSIGMGVVVAGEYITNGGSVYHVDVGGTVQAGTPGTPGDPLADPPIPPTEGTPSDSGPSGTGFTTEPSGIVYRYVPDLANVSSYGAGTWSTTMYIMNDQRIGFERFQEILDASPARRDK